ncbi:WSC domain containing protein [Colletotrichum plurivorum]|uniref:WSC domain containing protein n=1 Tax=Colletotrichum plurivorum TaxID=2175906 RepID=A0A8H6N7D0_9PEZI|nr:WSC domain containing protein [Colletotrichum plurivorum]
MKFSVAFVAAFVGAAAAQSATTTQLQRPSEAPTTNALKSQGCFNASSTSWKKYSVPALSVGKCGDYCTDTIGSYVAALNGEDCYCGSEYPPRAALVKDSFCSFPCPNYGLEACGGIDPIMFYSVYNTGKKLVVTYEQPATTSVASTAKPTSTAGGAVETIIETPTSEPTPTETGDSKKGGTNVAGIAAGVVVGVVAIAAIVGGAFFFIRRKRNKEIEEEHRRNAAVSAFIGGSKPPSSSGNSMADSRMDPTLAHRRMSDGSIADNQDYSRKILRVTNA